MPFHRISVVIIVFLHILIVSGKTAIRHWGTEEIGARNFFSIVSDSDGFVWIGTDYGLRRFDGTRFKSYLQSDADTASIHENNVRKIVISESGDMWVGTGDGIHLYHPESDNFSLIRLDGIETNGYINDASVDIDGGVIFIASGIGVFKALPDKDVATFFEKGLLAGKQRFSRLAVDKSGDVWIGCSRPTGILRVKPGDNHVKKYGGIKGVIVSMSGGGHDSPVTVVTSTDTYIYSQEEDKFIKSATETFVPSLFGKDIRTAALTVDNDSNVWFGVNGKGLYMLNDKANQFCYFDLTELSSDGNMTTSVVEGADKSFWVNWPDTVLTLVSRNGDVKRRICFNNAISDFYDNLDGTLYLWENKTGLIACDCYSGKTRVVVPYDGESESTAMIRSDEMLFVAVDGCGLLRLNMVSGSHKWFSAENSNMVNNWINSLALSRDRKVLWLGHFGGVSRLDMQSDEVTPVANRWFDRLACHSMSSDNKGNIWIGSNKGLIKYSPETGELKKYSRNTGLSDNIVTAVVVDLSGNVWCSTANGINKVNPLNDKIDCYYGGNGIGDKRYNKGKGFLSVSGEVYFGGEHGVLYFDPARLPHDNFESEVIISEMQVNGNAVNMLTRSGGKQIISSPVHHASVINLTSKNNNLSLFLTTSGFHDCGNVQYEYRFDGEDASWYLLPLGENVLRFHNLGYGSHRLQIRALENGTYSALKSLDINVSAPWFLSDIAKLFYIVILILAALLIFKYMKRMRREKMNEAMLDYFVNMSHELRSPVSLIISPLESLMKSVSGNREKELLTTIHLNASRVMGLLDQLLDIRKIDKGKMRLCYSRVNLVTYISDVAAIFRFQAASRNIRLEVVYSEDEIYCWIDTGNFDKVLINLISNAFKFTPDNGEIVVGITVGKDETVSGPLHDFVKITVSDTGSGISENDTKRIFERFFQSRRFSAHTGSKGFGIGLNLCKALVELHHGKICVDNRQDRDGTIFSIFLPAGRKHLSDKEIAVQESPSFVSSPFETNPISLTSHETPPNLKTHGNFNILIVDDSAEVVEYLKTQLESKYNVLTASDGSKALEVAIRELPDIVISDVIMPGIDGIELLRRLKSNVATNYIPVVLLSTRNEVVDRVKGLDYGADAYIGKPFVISEIEAVINGLISNRLRLKGKYSGSQEQEERVKDVELRGNDEILMERVMAVINENIGNPDFNIETLCDRLAISRVHLHRKMKNMVGMSSGEFIRNLRFKQACRLLKKKDLDITQIAYAVGFTNPAHFATTFKKYFGLTPTEYRESNQSESAD